jgi:tetraacyldisaccharide 4'-kinase
MMQTAPDFWGKEPGFVADLLRPLGAVWDTAGRLHRALARPYQAPAPVVCIGNLVAGGAGKTPVALSLGKWLMARGIAVHAVTRGYGGRLVGPCRVDIAQHNAREVGDEALLLADHMPSWVARDRAAGAAAAVAAGAKVILLDDGFQNPSIGKTLSVVVVDSGYGFGNGRVMPAGPLREDRRRGLARADAVVLLTVAGEQSLISMAEFDPSRPIIPAVLIPLDGERFAGQRLFAFAGIGRPARFFATLRALGAELVAERAFPDHYAFSEHDMAELCDIARRAKARLVTTAKDFVRLPPAAHGAVEVLEVEVHWPDAEKIARLLNPMVLAAGGNADPIALAC